MSGANSLKEIESSPSYTSVLSFSSSEVLHSPQPPLSLSSPNSPLSPLPLSFACSLHAYTGNLASVLFHLQYPLHPHPLSVTTSAAPHCILTFLVLDIYPPTPDIPP
eukprot:65086-Hanusia_phi.AAC.1